VAETVPEKPCSLSHFTLVIVGLEQSSESQFAIAANEPYVYPKGIELGKVHGTGIVGFWVGFLVGLVEGTDEGFFVGHLDGFCVGFVEGVNVGSLVGLVDGDDDGFFVGN